MTTPRLISFKICPFAQRSALLLREKAVEFKQEFINPAEPPLWFAEISPTGKVPVLDVDGTAIFESSVINEYLNEIHLPSIHPEDPLIRATNRAWVEYTSPIYMGIFKWITADNESDEKKARTALENQLAGLEDALNFAPYFNGDTFSMVDIAAAPIAVRLEIIKELTQAELLNDLPKTKQWFDTLLQRKTVTASYPEDLKDILAMKMKSENSHLLKG